MKVLFNIAVGTAVVGTGAMIYVQLKQMEQVSSSDYFREAFKLLRAHPGILINSFVWKWIISMFRWSITGAVHHLGEPIKQLGYKVDDPDNFLGTDKAQFQVNVKGPNDKGNNY